MQTDRIRELEKLNPFAVQFRYETLDETPEFEIEFACNLAHQAYNWARMELEK